MNYHCVKFCTNISTNMDTTNNFPFLAIFSTEFRVFYPQNSNFLPIYLGIIGNIVS